MNDDFFGIYGISNVSNDVYISRSSSKQSNSYCSYENTAYLKELVEINKKELRLKENKYEEKQKRERQKYLNSLSPEERRLEILREKENTKQELSDYLCVLIKDLEKMRVKCNE